MSCANCWTDIAPRLSRATEQCKSDAQQNHHGGNIEDVEGKSCGHCFQMKCRNVLAKNECAVNLLIVRRALKVHPSKRQRERYSRSQNASPGNQPVCCPAHVRAFFNESLLKEVGKKHLCQPNDIAGQLRWTKEDPPALKPVFARRRAPEPHGKTVADPEGGEHTGSGIGHERRIIVLQAITAGKDEDQKRAGHYQSPDGCVGYVTAAGCGLDQVLLLSLLKNFGVRFLGCLQ